MTIRIDDGVLIINDKPYRWAKKVHVSDVNSGNFVWKRRGAHLLFENGWTLSVQWGMATYSDNKDAGFGYHDSEFKEEVDTVEIAVWLNEGLVPWANSGDQVCGWVTADQVEALIEWMKSWPSDKARMVPLTLPVVPGSAGDRVV